MSSGSSGREALAAGVETSPPEYRRRFSTSGDSSAVSTAWSQPPRSTTRATALFGRRWVAKSGPECRCRGPVAAAPCLDQARILWADGSVAPVRAERQHTGWNARAASMAWIQLPNFFKPGTDVLVALDNRVSTPHIGICVATTPCKECRVSRIVESDDPTWAMCIRALSLSVSEWWHRTANAVGSRSARSSRFDSCVTETLSAEVR
jgi:hypothetical protein